MIDFWYDYNTCCKEIYWIFAHPHTNARARTQRAPSHTHTHTGKSLLVAYSDYRKTLWYYAKIGITLLYLDWLIFSTRRFNHTKYRHVKKIAKRLEASRSGFTTITYVTYLSLSWIFPFSPSWACFVPVGGIPGACWSLQRWSWTLDTPVNKWLILESVQITCRKSCLIQTT